ncbi:MAG: DNA-binding response regulator [Porphyromonadaceae bacterium CG2_30_38_12]|nr:MAG: DNA-binding response regulator [Porphyromonadaceae bacterium CG2_30_38_12]
MRIKCLAIDDEPLALQQISAYIDRTPFLEKMALCQSAYEAIEFTDQQPVDLMFVDINMPDLNGLDFVKSLKNKPFIIFTTAYSEYALEGFKVDAVDYILKPISYDEFLRAVNKVRDRMAATAAVTSETVTMNKESLFVKSEYKLVRIQLSDIKYIESANEYIQIHLDTDKPITTLVRLKTIEAELPKDKFMRVHRSFIVNLDKVKVIDRNRIVFDKVYIPVGDQYKDEFQKFVDKTFLV